MRRAPCPDDLSGTNRIGCRAEVGCRLVGPATLRFPRSQQILHARRLNQWVHSVLREIQGSDAFPQVWCDGMKRVAVTGAGKVQQLEDFDFQPNLTYVRPAFLARKESSRKKRQRAIIVSGFSAVECEFVNQFGGHSRRIWIALQGLYSFTSTAAKETERLVHANVDFWILWIGRHTFLKYFARTRGVISDMEQGPAKVRMQSGKARIQTTRLLPGRNRRIGLPVRKIQCSEQVVCRRILRISLQRRLEHIQRDRAAREYVSKRHLFGQCVVSVGRLVQFLPAVGAIAGDDRMVLREHSAGFSLIRRHGRILQ